MKKFMILLALVAPVSQVFADVQKAVDIPAKMECAETLNIFGSSSLESFTLDLSEKERVIQKEDDDLFVVDFSDGDQITKYTFQRSEVERLNGHEIKSITGTAWYGFWYSDGDHVNGHKVIECSL